MEFQSIAAHIAEERCIQKTMPNPDQEHAIYYKENPNGNHKIPSLITQAFMEKTERTFEKLDTQVTEIREILIEFRAKTEAGIKTMHEKQDHTNGWIADHEKEDRALKEEYGDMWKNQKEERKDNKYQLRGIAWEVIKWIIMGSVFATLTLIGMDKFIK